jgi:hypothetical protein
MYPFTPKSALKLQFGDYWPIRRDDGQFGFFVFLEQWAHMRSGVVAAVLAHVQTSSQLEPTGNPLPLHQVGHLHVKTFAETSSEIHGNVASRLVQDEVLAALKEQRNENRLSGATESPSRWSTQLKPKEPNPSGSRHRESAVFVFDRFRPGAAELCARQKQ